MKIPFMRFVDSAAGVPLCWLLNGGFALANLMNLGRHRRAARAREAPRRILVMKFLGLGTIMLAGPLLRALRTRHPGCRIEVATFAENIAVVSRLPGIDGVVPVSHDGPLGFVVDSLRLLTRCWTRGYDAVIDLEVYSKYSTLLVALSGAPVRVGFFELTTRFRRGIYSDLFYFNKLRHITRVLVQAGTPFGAVAPDERPLAPEVTEKDRSEALELVRGAGLDGHRLLLVNPNASDLCTERRWPPEAFARTVSRLLERHSELGAVFIGAPAEREFTRSVREAVDGAVRDRTASAAGSLSLPGALGLLSSGVLLLTNDSGPLHLAWALGVPTVSLWGPGTPLSYGPLGPGHTVINRLVPCSPCLYFTDRPPCGGVNVCMTSIGEDEVVAACEDRLAARAVAGP